MSTSFNLASKAKPIVITNNDRRVAAEFINNSNPYKEDFSTDLFGSSFESSSLNFIGSDVIRNRISEMMDGITQIVNEYNTVIKKYETNYWIMHTKENNITTSTYNNITVVLSKIKNLKNSIKKWQTTMSNLQSDVLNELDKYDDYAFSIKQVSQTGNSFILNSLPVEQKTKVKRVLKDSKIMTRNFHGLMKTENNIKQRFNKFVSSYRKFLNARTINVDEKNIILPSVESLFDAISSNKTPLEDVQTSVGSYVLSHKPTLHINSTLDDQPGIVDVDVYQANLNKFIVDLQKMEPNNLKDTVISAIKNISSTYLYTNNTKKTFDMLKSIIDTYYGNDVEIKSMSTFLNNPKSADETIESLQLKRNNPDKYYEVLTQTQLYISNLKYDEDVKLYKARLAEIVKYIIDQLKEQRPNAELRDLLDFAKTLPNLEAIPEDDEVMEDIVDGI